MGRLINLVLGLAILAGIAIGISWALAYNTVGTVLGSPPPAMGDQKTTFLWHGAPNLPGHPRAWRFVYGPTRIPGAPSVQILVSPTGRLLLTSPGDLTDRIRLLHPV